MTINATYTLTGTDLHLTYAAESGSLDITLGDSFSPFNATHQLQSTPADHEPGTGIVLTGTIEHRSVGRGGPIVRTARLTVFLPDAPEPGSAAVELAATGAVVTSNPEAGGDAAPQYQAAGLTGTVTVPAAAPAGRF
ncbi:hypothetical protein ACIBCN_05315 [Nocardia sp. NPDC051052]|uniref:hypothetical protein n=1 Tax=Nocardia sp. NPDC051052 TaxID=3364322 RepID=UPI00378FAA54